MKKILASLLALSMTLALGACGGGDSSSSTGSSTPAGDQTSSGGTDDESGAVTPAADARTAKDQLVVGSVTDIDANMMSGWTNGAMNAGIRNLIFQSGTVSFTEDGDFVVNESVVEKFDTTENEDGSKTFTFTIKEGLKFSDGSPITVKDFVFATLLLNSPEFGGVDGADNANDPTMEGFEAYQKGQTKILSGLRLIDDKTFSVTHTADNFPYFYEKTLASYGPLPMAVIVPDCDVADDGEGAYITGDFTSELLMETINNAETGYRYNPQVTCGPYKFVSYDASTKECVLEINENYQGTHNGTKASIPKLVLKKTNASTEIEELGSGSVDLLPGISGGTEINAGLELFDQGKVSYVSYARAGYGKVQFACNHGPTQYPSIRKAIIYCLDREEFARQYSGGYAKVVDGYYGLSQWEYKEKSEELEEKLVHYSLDLEKAKEILEEDGWVYNKDGGDYVEGTDEYRCKKLEDGTLVHGIIRWANSPDNPVSTLLSQMLPDNMAAIGLKLEPTTIDFNLLLDEYYQRGGAQNYEMFNLATGFATTSPVWYYFNPDLETYGGLLNTDFIVDDELYNIALQMKATDPSDREKWADLWVDLQVRWNELVPQIPLYSDLYHEFYVTNLEDYRPDGLWNWSYAIPYASLS